jgi:hypothetical protein
MKRTKRRSSRWRTTLRIRGLDGKILRSSGWLALSLGGNQLASILALLVLARLLEPKVFGLVALAATVLAFAEQIQESGTASARSSTGVTI